MEVNFGTPSEPKRRKRKRDPLDCDQTPHKRGRVPRNAARKASLAMREQAGFVPQKSGLSDKERRKLRKLLERHQLGVHIRFVLSFAIHLIPSSQDYLRLLDNATVAMMRQSSNNAWRRFMTEQEIFGSAAYLRSLMTRAKALVDQTLEEGLDTFLFMDGHGRFLYCLMTALSGTGRDPDNFHFIVVDVDQNSHNWHKIFFPRKVKCVHRNIFDYIEKTEALNYCVPYLNFCGLGDQQEMLVDFMWKVMLNNESQKNPHHTYMLSYSRQRAAINTTKTLTGICNDAAKNVDTDRDDFVSYLFE